MPDRVICDICSESVEAYSHYVVRIEVFADPTLPPLDTEQATQTDLQGAMQHLIDQMSQMSTDELQDQVHRRFEYHLCAPCQKKFLVNPLGKPREMKAGKN